MNYLSPLINYRTSYFFAFYSLVFLLSVNIIPQVFTVLVVFVVLSLFFIDREGFGVHKNIRYFYYISLFWFFSAVISVVTFNYENLFIMSFEPYWVLLLWPLIYFSSIKYINNLILFKKIFVILGLIYIFFVFFVVYSDPVRGLGFLESPIVKGNLGMMVGLMSFVLFFYFKDLFWRLLAVTVFFCGVYFSFLTGSRGGWLALFISFFTILLFLYFYDREKLKSFFIVLFVFALIFIFSWQFLPISDRILAAYENVFDYFSGTSRTTSLGYRFDMWLIAINEFIKSPVWGHGFNSFGEVYKGYIESGHVPPVSGRATWRQPHNDYLRVLVEQGLIGFIPMMLFFFYPFVFFIRKIRVHACSQRKIAYLGLMGIVMIESIMEFMLTDMNITTKYFMYIYIFTIVLIMSLISNNVKPLADRL
ncbi:MAG: O-antigen ligase family protein [Methyloprofundus sp.]|nr:O-antigen ligase family protein [Methyloprofundus sp.]